MLALRSEEVRTQVHRVNTKISAGWSSHHEDAAALKNFRFSFVALEDLNAKLSAYKKPTWTSSLPE